MATALTSPRGWREWLNLRGIYLSRAAYEQVVGKVAAAFTEVGVRSLKNIDTPVQIFRVSGDGEGRQDSLCRRSLRIGHR